MNITIPDFSQARVLVAGDVMVDRYFKGATERISPEAPVPVVHVHEQEQRLGGAANVAHNLAALSVDPVLLGFVGDDPLADWLEESLGEQQIESLLQRVPEATTVTKLRILSRNQQLIRLDFETEHFRESSNQLQAPFEKALASVQAVVLSDYGKGALVDPQPFIQQARAANIPVIVDPKGRDFSRYQDATLITPNLKEFEEVVGPCETEQQLVDKGMRLLIECNLDALLITRGADGMTLLQKGKKDLYLPTYALDVFDVTGAGDTVIATVAACLASGADLETATALANLAASVAVKKVGTATVTLPELRRMKNRTYKKEDTGSNEIVSEAALVELIEDAKAHGERVVMTNGCFDILHPGHVAYLQQAKRLGDILVVAVNDDASIKRYKGPTRPINNLDQRMRVLSGLRSVDWVLPFSEDTPRRLIELVKPDVLVKGGDWTIDQIVGADIVLAYGGEVQSLIYHDGLSTTDIIERARK